MKFLAKRYPGCYEFNCKKEEKAFLDKVNESLNAERDYLDSAKEYMSQNPGKGLSDYKKEFGIERPKRADFIVETIVSYATTSTSAETVQIELI